MGAETEEKDDKITKKHLENQGRRPNLFTDSFGVQYGVQF
jgi:hypothetical protein